jgi:NADPH:quinone reductase
MTIPSTMQAMRASGPGPAHGLESIEVPTPTPGPGQILIRVEAASVNFSDIKRRRGDVYPFPTTFPYIPGGEVAGTVAALGQGVEGLATGTSVFALVGGDGQGGYAQFAVAYAPQVVPMPPGLTAQQASILIIAGATAGLLIEEAVDMKPGETILIPAATGGVGSFALQLARNRGARMVIALSSSKEKAQRARTLGAHHAVIESDPTWPDQVRELTQGKGVDAALESAGGLILEQTLACLASFGRLVVYGSASARPATLSNALVERLFYNPSPNQSLLAFNLGTWFMERPQAAQKALGAVIGALMQGRITWPEIHTAPLRAAGQVHAAIESRLTSGKHVLLPWQ